MTQAYWIFGKNSCKAVLQNQDREILEIRAITSLTEEFRSNLHRNIVYKDVSQKELDNLLPGAVHQGVAIRVLPVDKPHLDWVLQQEVLGKSIILILDQITDPHNVGAIMRTAAAFNASAIIMTNRNSVRESGVVAKAAAGALELVPIIEVANLVEAIKALKKVNYWVFAMDGSAKDDVSIVANYEKIAIVLGSEGSGIRDLVAKNCDLRVKITMSEKMESLNVSNACAIALFAATKL